ncbi:MAG: M48 family metalloprotease [Cyclobacteriaceae bacterium]|nr:M48 family metalloprotease [Cyclobacteriaceae bacterium]
MEFSSILYSAFLLSLLSLMVKYVVLMVMSLFAHSINPLKLNNYKDDIILLPLILLGYSVLLLVIELANPAEGGIYSFLLILFGASIVPIVRFTGEPIITLFRSRINKNHQNEIVKKKIQERFQENYHIYVIDKKIMNAYATGILPFTKIILIGEYFLENLKPEIIDAILTHEIAHLKYNHLLKLMLTNILWISITIFSFSIIRNLVDSSNLFAVFLMGYFGLVGGGGLLFVNGLVQKRLEKQADLFAVKKNGKAAVKEMLLKLNELSNDQMTKWSFNYPTLNERLENISRADSH